MPERRVTIAIAEGLHARPAALFAKLAAEQSTPATIRKPHGEPVPAASILSLMALGASAGDEVVLTAEGDGAETTLATLGQYLATAQ
jgi:phosphocarrier protein HPr